MENSRETWLANMENKNTMDKRQKYKTNQIVKGFSRLELSIPKKLRQDFEAMAQAISDEYIEPEDRRQRLAKAKVQLIEELTQNINHEFFVLKDKISRLEAMVEFLSPSFDGNTKETTTLPSSIKNLTNDPDILKGIIANLYKEKTTFENQAKEYKRRSEQYLKLYELSL